MLLYTDVRLTTNMFTLYTLIHIKLDNAPPIECCKNVFEY